MDKNAKEHGVSVGARRVISYIVLIFVTVLCLFWFYLLFINTTRSNGELSQGFKAYPSTHLFENFSNVMHNGTIPIFNGLLNSLIIAVCTTALCTYFSTMTAYAIHVYDFKLKKFAFMFILAIMMIPTQVTALGFIELMRSMKLMDTFIPLIIPSIASPITFFYMKQYMESTLPLELCESARIDGAGEFRIFNQIAMPIMRPAIAVQAIFSFVASWNNYFTPQLVLSTKTKKTLPILIAELRSADWLKFDMGQVYMMITLSILPVIVLYIILSKNIVAGMTVGAVKG